MGRKREIVVTCGAFFTFNLEFSDLSGVVDIEVFEEGLGSLSVLVRYLLGLGIDLLLPLFLSS